MKLRKQGGWDEEGEKERGSEYKVMDRPCFLDLTGYISIRVLSKYFWMISVRKMTNISLVYVCVCM